jgi:hypothetical protein
MPGQPAVFQRNPGPDAKPRFVVEDSKRGIGRPKLIPGFVKTIDTCGLESYVVESN